MKLQTLYVIFNRLSKLIAFFLVSVLRSPNPLYSIHAGPEILANFAKNVASVISPVILSDTQSRSNRSTFKSVLAIPVALNTDELDNVVDKIPSAATYYESNSNSYTPYKELFEDPAYESGARANGELEESLRDETTYLRQERPILEERLYDRPYDFSPSGGDFEADRRSDSGDIEGSSSITNIEESPSNTRYSSYNNNARLRKTAVGPDPFLGARPYGGFGPGYGPGFGHFPGYYPHHPYGNGRGGDESSSSGGAAAGESARLENNGTARPGYGPPYFGGHGYHHHPYSSFPYGYPNYEPYPYGPRGGGSENDTSANGRNGHYGYGPYRHGPDLYGPPNYGYNYGHNGNNQGGNGNDGNSRQTEQPADNDNQNNATKNGYPSFYPFGPPFLRPYPGGIFHLHGFPSPFSLLPYDHFHFKGGPVVGVGHVGYPIYADPFLIGFPFHSPYGPYFHGKQNKYLPPKGKPSDSGESGEPGEQTESSAAGELTEDEGPGRIIAPNEEVVAPAPTSNRYQTSQREELRRIDLINFGSRKI